MDIINLTYYFAVPMISFYFCCKYCGAAFHWLAYTGYVLSYALALRAEVQWGAPGILRLIFDVLLLTVFLSRPFKGKLAQAFAVSVLAASAYSVCFGATQMMAHWAAVAAGPEMPGIMQYADTARAILSLLFFAPFLYLIGRVLGGSLTAVNRLTWFLLAVPVFFISLVEKIVETEIYGNTAVWDSSLGLVYPKVNTAEIFLLQVFAFVCLLAALAAYQKLTKAIASEQDVKLLEQQAQIQEAYIQEARSRYGQTRSFRHDIKNHLTVLGELLKAGQQEEAYEYLSHLEQASAALSFPVQTGNAAVDALLGSKLSVAAQQGINVRCAMKLPEGGRVKSIDWCIALSNAVDNAIQANCLVPPEKRYLHIMGKAKGNFYLLYVENPCREGMEGPPHEGIGISNIKAIAGKYGGTAEIAVSGGAFKLSLLFVISQP